MAANIGVSMALFDDNFLTVLRNGIQTYADANGHTVQIEDAQNDVAKQLDQINNFIASGVDAIIVNPVDTSATQAMSDAAAAGERAAGLRQPPADQPRHAARQPGVRRVERSRTPARSRPRKSAACSRKPARPRPAPTSSWASSPTRPPCSAPQDIHDVIGGADCGVKHHHHRRADLELAPRRGPEPDDQLALDQHAVRCRHRQQRRDRRSAPSRR